MNTMFLRQLSLLIAALLLVGAAHAQIFLNEVSNRNLAQIADENGDHEDWIELYNAGPAPVNLGGFGLSDDPSRPLKWTLPSISLAPQSHLLVFASGKDRKPRTDHWETAVDENSSWKYFVPNAQPDPAWTTFNFAPAGWTTGTAGFGYGDGDDATVLPAGTQTVLLRTLFTVPDTALIAEALLSMDYDDGFVAYLNGIEIARSGLGGTPPAWDEPAADHEAVMYAGQNPESFAIAEALLRQALLPGDNLLAVEVHNTGPGSSDLTARPFLHFGLRTAAVQFGPNPAWFALGGGPTELHTNFKLDANGEPILLSDAQGNRLDSLWADARETDLSVGRSVDGGPTVKFFETATPNASNNGAPSFNGFAAEPHVLVPAGHYAPGLAVEVQSFGPTVVRYTVDGQTPDNFSALYMGPITLDSTTVLKMRAFSLLPGIRPSRTVTRTYLLSENFTVPIVSITMDDDDLYGGEGIYDNWWTDWERPCTLEFFENNGTARFSTRSGIRIDGGAGGSRSQPQRSFRLEPDHGIFGEGDVDYPVLPGRPGREDYETLYLRNGSNMWMNLTFKDQLLLRAHQNMEIQYSEYRPVAVYLNGEYWGLYELREKLDPHTYQEVYGADQDSMDLLAISYWYNLTLRAVRGSVDGFLGFYDQTMQANPTDPNFFAQVDEQLDLKAFADYFIAETWSCNVDWPYNNIRFWRSPGLDNRWRFSAIDLELGMGWGGWIGNDANMIDFLQNYDPNNLFANLYRHFMQNDSFRVYFINRYADMMNTEYQPGRLTDMANAMRTEFLPEMPRNFQRWGAEAGMGSLQEYLDRVNFGTQNMIDNMTGRNFYARQHIQNGFALNGQVDITLEVQPAGAGVVRINTIQPGPLPWQGVYFDGVPVTVTAIPNPGFAFSHWDNNPFINDPNGASFVRNITSQTAFVAHFDAVGGPTVAISEINYNSDPTRDAGDWVEFHNYGQAPLDLTGWYFTDADPLQQYVFPNGTVMAPGERLVVVRDPILFALEHPGVPHLSFFDFGLSGAGDEVNLYAPPGVLYLSVPYTDSLPWPTGADGGGRTLELLSVGGAPSDPANWFDGCMGGSPGAPYTPCNDPIVFSEINYNSDTLLDTDDWVELHNTGNSTLDLSGWQFSDDNDLNVYTIPPGTLLYPDSHLVLHQTTAKFQQFHPDVLNTVGPFLFNLSGAGDRLRLFDASGRLQFSVDYRDSIPWPEGSDGNGYTLELLDELGVMNNGANWFDGCLGGSPGVAYFTPCQDTATGTTALPPGAGAALFPNPTGRHAELRLDWPERTPLALSLFDATGRILRQWNDWTAAPGSNRFALDFDGIAPGMYILRIRTGAGSEMPLRIVVAP